MIYLGGTDLSHQLQFLPAGEGIRRVYEGFRETTAYIISVCFGFSNFFDFWVFFSCGRSYVIRFLDELEHWKRKNPSSRPWRNSRFYVGNVSSGLHHVLVFWFKSDYNGSHFEPNSFSLRDGLYKFWNPPKSYCVSSASTHITHAQSK